MHVTKVGNVSLLHEFKVEYLVITS